LLYGERRSDLAIESPQATAAGKLTLGGDAEPTTTSEEERAKREIKFPSWTSAEYVLEGRHWLFLVNSANETGVFKVSGWPEGSRATSAFEGAAIGLKDDESLRVELPAYGVSAICFAPGKGTDRLDRK
jgi:hypothetical protein